MSAPAHSLVPPVFSPSVSSFSSFVPPVTSFPSFHPAPSSSFAPSVIPGDPRSFADVSTGPGLSLALGWSCSVASCADVDVFVFTF